MIDEREIVRRAAEALTPPEPSFDRLLHRRDRVQRNRRIRAGVLGLAVAIAVGWLGINAIRSAPPKPADDRSEELGFFAPVSGRIVYMAKGLWVADDVEKGVWAVDPNGPSDTVQGPKVADDVASTLVRLDLREDALPPGSSGDGVEPLGWSSDGTELLVTRWEGFEGAFYVVHADGTETQLSEKSGVGARTAAISPDGSRVAFASEGLTVVDVESGAAVKLPTPAEGEPSGPLTFSPDGTQIAYLSAPDAVWVVDANGRDAHEIVANEATRNWFKWFSGMQWSPAGDRIAIGLGGDQAIYTFAPDGSDFRKLISGGSSPFWSPDGSQIAYTIRCDKHADDCPHPSGLAIADADGSNVRAFGFAASGPWHPGGSVAVEPEPTPVEPEPILGGAGEVLRFTGVDGPGDLIAVDSATGEERVLVEDLEDVSNARWSADRRWVAFEMAGSLWVVDQGLEPRQVFDAPNEWSWSSTGARLAVFRGSTRFSEHTLYVIDPSTGRATELASIVEDVFTPVWSADGTRILFGVRGGAVYSVDARTGAQSLFVQLPGKNLDSIDAIEWSPDGSRVVIFHNGQDLFVVNADGSGLRALAEGALVFGFDWSPDGSQIAWTEDHGAEFRVFVAPRDGSTPSLVASLPNAPANPVWSPDGSQIAFGHRNAFLTDDAPNLVIDADGSGDAVPLDDLTYESWRGGRFDCDCDIFG